MNRKCCDSPKGCGPHREGCIHNNVHKPSPAAPHKARAADVKPDWSKKCVVCGNSPVLPLTSMCGPCTFGEAKTMGGNW